MSMAFDYFMDMQAQEAPSWRRLRITEHTARKGHTCDLCRGLIPPKTRYRVEVVLFDGELEVTKTCGACLEGARPF